MNRNHSEVIPCTDGGPSPSKKFCPGVSSSNASSDQVANGAQQQACRGKSHRKPVPTRRPFITAGILQHLQQEAQNATPDQSSASSEQTASAARTSRSGLAPQFISSELKALASMDSEHLRVLAKMACSPPAGHIRESQTMRPSSVQPPATVRQLSEKMLTTRRSANKLFTTTETPTPSDGIPALPILGSPFPTPSVLDPGKLEALTTMNSKKLLALKKAAAASSTIQSLLSKLHGNSESQSCSSSQGGDHDNQYPSQEDDVIAEAVQYVLSNSEKQEECSDVNSDTCHFSSGQKNRRTFQSSENSGYMECKSVRAMDAECNKQFSNIEDDCSEYNDDGWYDHNRNKGNQQNFKKKRSIVGNSFGGCYEGSSHDRKHKDRDHFSSDKNWTYVDLDAPGETYYEDQVYDNTAEDTWEDDDQDDTEKTLKQIVDTCRSKLVCGMIGKRRQNAVEDDAGIHQSEGGCWTDNYSNEEVGLLSQFLALFRTWPDSSSSKQTLDDVRVSCGCTLPVRFEVEELTVNVRPLYTAVLSIGPFFLVRGLGICRKTMECECFDRAVHILHTKSVSEIRGLSDCGKDSLLEEVHRLSTEDPEAFTSLLYEKEEEDVALPEEAQASFTPQGPKHGGFEQGVMCDSNTLQEPEHRGFPHQGVVCASNTPQGPERLGFPQQGVMCASNTPQGPELRGFPQQGVMCASNTPQGPERRGFPQQGVMCASNTPQGPDYREFPQQGVMCASNTPQGPERRGFPQQGVMCASNTPQGPEHRGFPQQGLMCASNTPQGPECRGFPQGVMCTSNTPQGPEHRGFPQQGVMCASNIPQGPERRGFLQQGVMCTSNTPQGPEHRGFPQQGLMCASNTPQGPEHRGFSQGVMCTSNTPQGPERRGFSQGVMCASNTPQGPERRGFPQQGVMCASNTPQGPECRGFPQGVMCASNTPQGPECRGFPQQGVMCASNTPQGPERRGFPQQGVMCASNTPQRPEYRGFPQQGVMCASNTPQGPERRGFPQGVMRTSNTPQGPEHRGFPQQGVMCASNTPQGPERRGFPPQGVMCASNTPQGPERRGFPPQGVMCAPNTPQGPEHRGFPQQGVMCASNTPQGPERRGFPPQGVMCAPNTPQGPERRGFPQGVMRTETLPFSVHGSSKQQQQKKMPDLCQSSHAIQNTGNHEQIPNQIKMHTIHMFQSEGSGERDKSVQFHETQVLNLPASTGYTHSHIQRTEAVERKGNIQSSKPTAKMVAKVEPWENVQMMPTVQQTEHTQLEEKRSHSTQMPKKSVKVKQLKSEIRDPRPSAPKHRVEANVHQMPDLVNIHTSVSQDAQKMQVANKPESSTKCKSEATQKTTTSARKCEVLLGRKMKLLFQEMGKADLAENVNMIDYLDFMCVKVGIHVMILYRRTTTEHSQQPEGGDPKGRLICEIFYDTIQVGCGEGQTCSEAQDAAYAHLASRLMVGSIDSVVQGRRLPPQPESLPGFVQMVLKGSRKAKEIEAEPVQQSQGQKTYQASQSSCQ